MKPKLMWKLTNLAKRLEGEKGCAFGLTPSNRTMEGYLVKVCSAYHVQNLSEKDGFFPISIGLSLKVIADDTWTPVVRVTNSKLVNTHIVCKPLTEEYQDISIMVQVEPSIPSIISTEQNTLYVGEVIGTIDFVNTLIPERDTQGE